MSRQPCFASGDFVRYSDGSILRILNHQTNHRSYTPVYRCYRILDPGMTLPTNSRVVSNVREFSLSKIDISKFLVRLDEAKDILREEAKKPV